jgi:hypothetical protein
MAAENIKNLIEALNEYFSQYELEELCSQHNISLDYSGTKPDHTKLAQKLLTNIDAGNNRRFLKALLDDLLVRCRETMENLPLVDNLYHKQMIPQLQELKRYLNAPKPAANAAQPFATISPTSKSDLVELFSRAKTEVTVVDTAPGAGSFECLRKVKSPIRLLTRKEVVSLDQNFIRALKMFRSKGRTVELRRYTDIHNCCILFNNRCWLASTSIKNAGNADFNIVEVVDFKSLITVRINNWWQAAETIMIG